MGKLSDYLNEARNLKSDLGVIKKTLKDFKKSDEDLKDKMVDKIEKILLSIYKSESEDVFDKFTSDLMDLLRTYYREDVADDIEKVTDQMELIKNRG